MHEWLRCSSGVGVTVSNGCSCGSLQRLRIIVIACHRGIRTAYERYATVFVTTLFIFTTSLTCTLSLIMTVVLHTATLSKVWSTVSCVFTCRLQRAREAVDYNRIARTDSSHTFSTQCQENTSGLHHLLSEHQSTHQQHFHSTSH